MLSPSYVGFKHSGVILDLPPEEVPKEQWTSVQNFKFEETASVRVGGYERWADAPLFPPMFALNVTFASNAYWIYCGATQVAVTDGESHWDITPVAGLTPTTIGTWNGTILNGVPALSNGKDAPIYWPLNTATPCATLPGWPAGAYCKVIRAFKYHLFALGVFDGSVELDSTVWWSAAAAPGNVPSEWTPTPANDAGDMDLGDTPGIIVDGLPLRDQLVVYKEFTTYTLSYVGGQYTYTNRKLFLTTGLQSINSCTEVNGAHWVFTGKDLIVHDGQNYKSLVQDKVKKSIVNSIDPGKLAWSNVTARHRNNQVWLAYATQGSPYLNKALIVNALTGDCGERELPNIAFLARGVVAPASASVSWDADPDAWDSDITYWDQQSYSPTEDSLLMVDYDAPALWSADTSDGDDGQPVYAWLERQSLPTNDNILRALVLRIVPRISGEPGEVVDIRVGGQAFFDQPITWSDPQPFTIGSSVACDFQIEGRLISVRFEATTMREWTLYSYKMALVDLGLY